MPQDPPNSSNLLQLPSPRALRERLDEIVLKDLLGPAGGPEEELDEDYVSDRYLVGMLAPQRQRISPELLDDLPIAGGEDSEEGIPEVTAPQPETLFPSSFGLTFSVLGDTPLLHVTARWGRYKRQRSATIQNKDGSAKTVWKREQVEGPPVVAQITEGAIGPLPAVEDEPGVVIQGQARKSGAIWMVTLFLVNGQEEPKRSRDEKWLFQPELIVRGADGSAIFCRRREPQDRRRLDPWTLAEEQSMAMLYRRQVEFVVGHGVAVDAIPSDEEPQLAVQVSTCVAPVYELPRQTPPTVEDNPALAGLVLDMKELADMPTASFAARLGVLPDAYEEWIRERNHETLNQAGDLLEYQEPAREALGNCSRVLERIRKGIELVSTDETAAEAFRFANRAMWLQRTRSLYAQEFRRNPSVREEEFDTPVNRSWYPFQLAFVLLNLPSVTDLHHPDRSHESGAIADLLWFPTGGGKTEAYLGLAAYTMAVRRLQGVVEGRPGDAGVAVLMRYTLRLLTLQQFQRAAVLMCACEKIRREALAQGDRRWGSTPFRIGLWVGKKTTPNYTEQSAEAIQQDHGFAPGSPGSGTPAQLTTCPWCGHAINAGKDIEVEPGVSNRNRTFIYCGDPMGVCLFSRRRSPKEGLPVVVVDEEVYRLLPALLIATVDKFAQMPWKGEPQMLFGQVNGLCPRHGFRSPELSDSDSHPKSRDLPPVRTLDSPPLRPPDLIIQDELHLISGPLGTLVGLYETAIDELCSWQVDGKRVRPKVIASTATIRRARFQVHSLFLRRVEVFPPHGTDIRDNFFSLQREPGEENPGRRYLGICAPGKRLKIALIRVYVAFLSGAQKLYDQHGENADPWMTLVGYFNSIRELGGMRRLVDDDVRSRLPHMDERGLGKRSLVSVEELTSRRGSGEIPRVLDLLEAPFIPQNEAKRKEMRKQGRRLEIPLPLDVLLATNMISVGVDVKRLGLMVVAGQPKTTADYIQATSRVGRSRPGLVCTVYNWARPRDLSHYERFKHYHATFYQHVEALSVTPFAQRALDRGLSGVLVSLVRLAEETFNRNTDAGKFDRNAPAVRRAVEAIRRRGELVTESQEMGDLLVPMLQARLEEWDREARHSPPGRKLGYKEVRDGVTRGLLQQAGAGSWDQFTCLNSLRDVEPTAGLILMDDAGFDEAAAQSSANSDI